MHLQELLICVGAYNCEQLWHTVQHETVLIIFTLILQTIITAQVMSIGGEGVRCQRCWKAGKWEGLPSSANYEVWGSLVRFPSGARDGRNQPKRCWYNFTMKEHISWCLEYGITVNNVSVLSLIPPPGLERITWETRCWFHIQSRSSNLHRFV